MNKNVWKFGLLAAVAMSIDNVPGLPSWLYPILRATAAASAVLAGYHYPSPPAGPTRIPIEVVTGLLVLCFLSAGCELSRFTLSVKNPTFGSLAVSMGGGVIGHPSSRTNAPTADSEPNSGNVVSNGVASAGSP
jgi:hypothetical protein